MGEQQQEKPKPEAPKPTDGQQQEQTFSQADVDRIVSERLARQAKEKFGDYDELKKDADGKKTLEEQLEKLRDDLEASNVAGLRSRIAAEFGVSTKKGDKGEPSDADLFLTGTDEATLTAQAQRLGVKVADQKKAGNVAKNEGGGAKDTGDGKDEGMREFTQNLFGTAD